MVKKRKGKGKGEAGQSGVTHPKRYNSQLMTVNNVFIIIKPSRIRQFRKGGNRVPDESEKKKKTVSRGAKEQTAHQL